MSDNAPELVHERRGPVLVLRLNRPEVRNALNGALMRALTAAIVDAEDDADIRVVVLTGSGDRAFCSGLDLRDLAGGESGVSTGPSGEPSPLLRLFRGQVDVPVVAAVNGAAVAGGFELVLGCDLVVASSRATFGLPEVKRALFPGGGGALLGTRVPLSVALEIALTGEPIDATRGYEIGLVNRVVPPEDVLDTAIGLADMIARNGPLAVRATKELVRLGTVDAARVWARQAEWFPVIFGSEDAREGARAFVEKRDPIWKGR